MNEHIKAVLSELDAEIAQLNELRNGLKLKCAGAEPVETAQPLQPGKVKPKHRRPRKVESAPKAEPAARNGDEPSRVESAAGSMAPSTLSGAMKREIHKLQSFTLEQLQAVVEQKYKGEEFYQRASGNAFYGNLAYWAKNGKLDKKGDGAQSAFRVVDAEFFSNTTY